MIRNRIFCSCLGLLLLTGISSGQIEPEKALKTFKVAEGLELKLWASEPLFVNPTCMDIDHLGRVWVCESVNYRCRLRRRPLRRKEGDRILILTDTNDDGKADKTTVFYQAPEILSPLGIAVAKDPAGPGYKVYVCQSPYIWLFEDKDGDGKADGKPKNFLEGFRGLDHDHGVHGILLGPDGRLYFSVGDQGVTNLQSTDGKGRKYSSNTTDCRAGTIWRCDLDGKNLELLAHNFRNEYEPAVDSFGNVFVSDNDDDGNRQTRICYVMRGGNYGYHPRGRGQTHWHEEEPGIVHKILRTGFGSPTGMCIYEGGLLPEKYRGMPLHTDAGPREVRCYHLKPNGCSFDVSTDVLVTSTDKWFRPSDVCVAPDGSVFIADWYDPGVGGHGIGDLTRGRIYRLAPKGNKPKVPKVNLSKEEDILAALGSPNLAVRHMGIQKIRLMKDPKRILFVGGSSGSPQLAARCFQLFAQTDDFRDDNFESGFRVAQLMKPLKASGKWLELCIRSFTVADLQNIEKNGIAKVLNHAVTSGSSADRREALLQLQHAKPSPVVKHLIYELAKKYDGRDRFYLNAIGIAVGHHDKARREAILADFEKHFSKWSEPVANLIWELRPPKVVSLLEKQLNQKEVSAEQRAKIVDILATSQDPKAGSTLVKALSNNLPNAVQQRILSNLGQYFPTKWRDLRQSKELNDAINDLMKSKESRIVGLKLIALAEKVGKINQVARVASDGSQSGPVRLEAIKALGSLPSSLSVEALKELLTLKPESLAIEVVRALGGLSHDRPNRPSTQPAQKVLRNLLTENGNKSPTALKVEAARALTESRLGSNWLLDLKEKKQLVAAADKEVGRVLRNSPFRRVRDRAVSLFPAPGKLDPKKLPSIKSLLARRGDVGRGQQLLTQSIKGDLQCMKCHTIRGVGGAIGPDLSMIGQKGSFENLYESILNPSKAIADQYVNWVIETGKGLSLTGLIVEESPDHIVLRDANGKDHRILKKDIEERTKSKVSLMPDNLLGYMTEDDLVDIVAQLATLKTPALSLQSWNIVGPFAPTNGLDTVYPPEKEVDLKAAYKGKHGKVQWQKVLTNGLGYVDLQSYFAGKSDQILSYLYNEIESPADQQAEILLGTDDGSRLWVNGKLVFTDRRIKAAQPGMDRVKVALTKGNNRLLLKIANGNGPHGFYFTILSEKELKAIAK